MLDQEVNKVIRKNELKLEYIYRMRKVAVNKLVLSTL